MKKYILLFVLFIGTIVNAQKDLNSYKCIVIPLKFDFQKQENQYGLNDLLKYKFNSLGFETYIENEDLPIKYIENPCLVLTPVIIKKRNLFKTILHIEIRNCYGKVLFVTKEGRSIEKNNKVACNMAVRESLKSFGDYKLEYRPLIGRQITKEYNQPIKNEVVKQNLDVSSLENKLSSVSFNYKGEEFILVNKGAILFEIQNKKTNAVVGKMIASGFKKGISHIEFNGKVGFGYYGENGSLIMEFMSSENSVEMISLPRIN
ncbi:MAG: hypothetical protein HRT69_04630 [Flavobacteriaceae bacterium]|nr:hypothetical protein [Flavobacteriaceae bacterium]